MLFFFFYVVQIPKLIEKMINGALSKHINLSSKSLQEILHPLDPLGNAVTMNKPVSDFVSNLEILYLMHEIFIVLWIFLDAQNFVLLVTCYLVDMKACHFQFILGQFL